MADQEIAPLLAGARSRRLYQGIWGQCLAEFLGTALLILIGCGSVAVAVVGLPGSGRTEGPTTFFLGAGDWMTIVWGWVFAVTFGVYVSQGVSGAHLNPAVTLGFAVRRHFPWKHVLPYWAAQLVGAFVGAAIVLGLYKDAIGVFDDQSDTFGSTGHTIPTLSIFSTFPAPYYQGGVWGPLFDQVVGTAVLMLIIAAVIDLRNKAVMANLGPLVIGLSVGAIGIAIGTNAGYAINPARDLGPRVLAWLGGWGELALPGNGPWFSHYFWVPIVSPLIGAVIGILVYDLLIGDVLHARALAEDPAGTRDADHAAEGAHTHVERQE